MFLRTFPGLDEDNNAYLLTILFWENKKGEKQGWIQAVRVPVEDPQKIKGLPPDERAFQHIDPPTAGSTQMVLVESILKRVKTPFDLQARFIEEFLKATGEYLRESVVPGKQPLGNVPTGITYSREDGSFWRRVGDTLQVQIDPLTNEQMGRHETINLLEEVEAMPPTAQQPTSGKTTIGDIMTGHDYWRSDGSLWRKCNGAEHIRLEPLVPFMIPAGRPEAFAPNEEVTSVPA